MIYYGNIADYSLPFIEFLETNIFEFWRVMQDHERAYFDSADWALGKVSVSCSMQ